MRTLRLTAALLVSFATARSWAGPITSVVAYGDSYSDNGNLGRESNGAVIVEQLAARLGVPLIDHAWVGSTTGIGNLSDGGSQTVLGQSSYPGMTTSANADLANGPADPSALYVVWGGHNDILVNGQDQASLNVVSIVNSLQAAGATHILVPGVFDLGLTPFSRLISNPGRLTTASDTLNARLAQLLPSGAVYVDTASILRGIVADPTRYGLSDVTTACRYSRACANPDQYLFWDNFHPTARAAGIFAADFAAAVAAVPEPSCMALAGVGGLLSIALRRGQRRKRA